MQYFINKGLSENIPLQVFDSFELEPHQECAYDHVALYDGESAESPLLGRFCGSKVPHPIISTAHTVLMAFRSDPSVQRNGFRATHSTGVNGFRDYFASH